MIDLSTEGRLRYAIEMTASMRNEAGWIDSTQGYQLYWERVTQHNLKRMTCLLRKLHSNTLLGGYRQYKIKKLLELGCKLTYAPQLANRSDYKQRWPEAYAYVMAKPEREMTYEFYGRGKSPKSFC